MINTQLTERLEFLKSGIDAQLKLGLRIMKAHGGAIYPLDFLSNAVLHRSMSLISGFCAMIEAKNFICAAPLLRLQLDNLIRFYAAFVVSDPHEFAMEVFRDKKVCDLHDAQGQKMTDRHLVKLLSKDFDWIERVYKHTSGYIHLSSKHIFNTLKGDDGSERKISFSVGPMDDCITDESRLEAVECMVAITLALNRYLEEWGVAKATATLVRQTKQRLQQHGDPVRSEL
jgi:hypothetical protein